MIDAYLAQQYMLTTVFTNEASDYIESWSAGSPVDGKWEIHTSEHGYGPLIINNIADEGKEDGKFPVMQVVTKPEN